MATGPRYRVRFRRAREGKTNYKKRRTRAISGTPRLVVRKTNKFIYAQLIKFNIEGDETLAQANSKELIKSFGWKNNACNVPAAYLTGLLIGKRAIDAKIKDVAFDIGANASVAGSRLYAVLKGVVDAGLNISYDESVLPKEDRIMGKHINENIQKDIGSIKQKIVGK